MYLICCIRHKDGKRGIILKNNTTRDHILEVATRLFHLQGYHATGLNQILKESNTPKGSLYHYFPNGKEQLVIEVIDSSSKRLQDDIQTQLNAVADPVTAVQNYLQLMMRRFAYLEDPNEFSMPPFSLIALESAFSNEHIRHACEENYRKVEQLYYDKFVESNVPTERATDIATTICAAIEGAFMLAITKKTNTPIASLQTMIPSFFRS